MIKIIGGNKKGYMLSVPKGNLVRPTSGMKKQAVFNILTSRYLKIGDTDLFSKKIVLDAFQTTSCYHRLRTPCIRNQQLMDDKFWGPSTIIFAVNETSLASPADFTHTIASASEGVFQ